VEHPTAPLPPMRPQPGQFHESAGKRSPHSVAVSKAIARGNAGQRHQSAIKPLNQTAVLRPLRRLMIRTTTARTSRM